MVVFLRVIGVLLIIFPFIVRWSPIEWNTGHIMLLCLGIILIKYKAWLNKFFRVVFFSFLCLWLIAVGFLYYYSLQSTETNSSEDLDYIVVLGSRVETDGSPSSSLQKRLDKGLAMYYLHNAVGIVVSGGFDGKFTEAKVMRDYLIAKGVDSVDIIIEANSHSTFENLLYTKRLLDNLVDNISIGIVSTDYHLPRIKLLSDRLGLNVTHIFASDANLNNVIGLTRETIAFVKSYLWDVVPENTNSTVTRDKLFRVERDGVLTTIYTYLNYTDTTPFQTLRLYPSMFPLPNELKGTFFIRTPLHRVLSFSRSHIGYLKMLNQLGTLKGMGDTIPFYNEYLQKTEKKIVRLGHIDTLSPLILRQVSPDAILLNNTHTGDSLGEQLLNVPYIFTLEDMEATISGRIAWAQFWGLLYEQEEVAMKWIDSVESSISKTIEQIKGASANKEMMFGYTQHEVWHFSGNLHQGDAARLLHSQFPFLRQTHTGDVQLNYKLANKKFRESDVWVVDGFNSLDELTTVDKKNSLFAPFKNKAVFAPHARTSSNGANDYFESSATMVHKLIGDYAKTLYPSVFKSEPFYFLVPLKDSIP